MPTSIKSFVPVQSTPPPYKPLTESRSRERREDFQQHLDGAATANKPAEPMKSAPKPEKAQSKKPSGKARAGGTTNGKGNPADHGTEVVGGESADLQGSATEAVDGDPIGAAEAETAEASVDADPAHVKGEDADHSGEDGSDGDVSPADAALLAQGAGLAQPVADNSNNQFAGDQEQQGGGSDGTGIATVEQAGESGERSKPASTATRVKPVGKPEPEADRDGVAEGLSDDAAVALGNPMLGVPGQGDPSVSEEGVGQGEVSAAAVAKKPVETKAASPGLGLQRVEAEQTPERSATKAATAGNSAAVDASAAATAASQVAALPGEPSGGEKDSKSSGGNDALKAVSPDATAAGAGQVQAQPQATGAHRSGDVPVPPPPPEVQFADANHDSIVTGVKAQLLPHGGSMQIRLDPPELGALKVMVEMRDGAMTATFQTSNEEATRLLSHSLNQLKHVLEGQGVNVERIQVQQAPKGESGSPGGNDDARQQQQQQNWQDEHAARQEQQRKEVLRRMWRRVSGVADPIDVTA